MHPGQQAFGTNPNVDTPYCTTVISEADQSNPPNPNGGLVFNPMNSSNPPNPNGGLVFNSMNSSNSPNPSNQNGGLVLTPTNAVPQPPLILRLTVWICFSRSHKTCSISSKTPKEKQDDIIRYVNVPLYNWIHFIDIFIFI